MALSIKHATMAATALGVVLAGSTALAASSPSNTHAQSTTAHATHSTVKASAINPRFTSTQPTIQQALTVIGDIGGKASETEAKTFLVSNGNPTTGTITPALIHQITTEFTGGNVTIQQGLNMVGNIGGAPIEAIAKNYLVSHGDPTTGQITPSLINQILSELESNGSGTHSSTTPGTSQATGTGSSYSQNVLPATFPNPSNLTPVDEPSLSGPSAGLQGEFTPSVTTIDGRPVLKAFHMVATSYGPSLADNYPYGATDYFGQPLETGMIAVDPSVIPLHSVVYVTGYQDNYLPSGGFLGQAMDTGGAIQGDRIDIFINANENVINDFGVQQVTVYELGN